MATGSRKTALVKGAGVRIGRATALALALFFLPVLFFGTAAGLEIVHPLAVTVLGGLVTSTVLVAFVVPALYLVFGASQSTVDEEA